jgi:hypothetical protein
VIELRIPPLRERPEDVLPIARAFLAEIARRMGRRVIGFTPRAADQLLRWVWVSGRVPGRGSASRALLLPALRLPIPRGVPSPPVAEIRGPHRWA